ncbi:MAG: XdhC family protein [Chloroflexota bacterium]
MRDVVSAIEQWRDNGEHIAIATVIKTLGSAPRGIGAKMAVSASGHIAGSVSGGCIEGAVFEACQHSIATGEAQLLQFGIANEEAWDVGLACGGQIDVLIEPLP